MYTQNTERMVEDLSDEFKQGIDSDTAKFKKLKKSFKEHEKERKKKMLSELQQKNPRNGRMQIQQSKPQYAMNSYSNQNMNQIYQNPPPIPPYPQQQVQQIQQYIPQQQIQQYIPQPQYEQQYQQSEYLPPSPPQPKVKDDAKKEEKEMEFIDSKSVLIIKYFEPYVSRDFLLTEQCLYELSTGDNTTQPQAYRSLIKLKSSSFVQTLKDSVVIKYDKFKLCVVAQSIYTNRN